MKARINGITIHYVDAGDPFAPSVTFIHGFPFSHAMWKPQIEAAGRFCRTLAYDVRGHGESDIGDGQYTIESHVDDLIALLDHLSIARTVAGGLSMGGYITLRALERYPERFAAAVLCDTKSEADSNEAKLKRAAGMVSVKREGAAAYADAMIKDLFAPESYTRTPDAIKLIRTMIAGTSPLSIAGTLLALAARTDTTPSLARIAVPVLILGGDQDAISPPPILTAMRDRIPGSELHIVPHAGHVSNLENAAFFNDKLVGFLSRIVSRR